MRARPVDNRARAFSLLEVMVAIAIVALIGALIFGAFRGMSRSRDNMTKVSNRYGQGRQALSRMSREISAAFISAHQPFQQLQHMRETAFIGSDEGTADRLSFTSFSNIRFRADTHVSDQAEISYFGARDPDSGNLDLVRRVDRTIDDEPERGGLVQVMAENIDSFEVRYLDPATGEWLDTWDSTQAAAQLGRLPAQVWIVLTLAGGLGNETIVFETKTDVPIQLPLDFATK